MVAVARIGRVRGKASVDRRSAEEDVARAAGPVFGGDSGFSVTDQKLRLIAAGAAIATACTAIATTGAAITTTSITTATAADNDGVEVGTRDGVFARVRF